MKCWEVTAVRKGSTWPSETWFVIAATFKAAFRQADRDLKNYNKRELRNYVLKDICLQGFIKPGEN